MRRQETSDQANKVDDLERILSDASARPVRISYTLIELITKKFSKEIGTSGFGVVYLGSLQNGMVVVKKFSSWYDSSNKMFLNEFNCLRKIKHKNIVRLLGYGAYALGEVMEISGETMIVDEAHKKFLCFEYAPNGNLEHYLKEQSYGYEWNMRYQIIKGICLGLGYLHQQDIYHLDLTPANVLLGAKMEPKIAGFGLSRCIDGKQSTIYTTNVCGTLGYMAPELTENQQISCKIDIFSLGIIMIKILTQSDETPTENWHESLDGDSKLLKKCIEIAQSCIDHDPHSRPTIHNIILMLYKTETMIQMIPPSINIEPRNVPMSPLYQIVKRFKALSIQTLHEDPGMENMKMEFDLLESIICGNENPSHLKLPFLQFITKNFSDELKIGTGGCAVVYKGILRNQSIAVKRLFNSHTIEDRMFHHEVKSMMMVNHKNVVRFLGYCSNTEERAVEKEGKLFMAEVRERLLCFEYLISGSLESYLTDELKGLEWQIRYQIIKGICNGLHHLHSENHIIHMDLKPANILLDSNMVPKITDFGLSRLDNISKTMSSERLGSLGYCAPEYLHHGKMSAKSDIYSLGVIILKLVTGSNEEPNITKVQRRWKHRWNKTAKDAQLGYKQVAGCLDLVGRCMQINPMDRLDICDIIGQLNELDSSDVKTSECMELEDMLGIPATNWTCWESPPRSKCSVTISMQTQDRGLPGHHCRDEFCVQSTRVDGSLVATNILRAGGDIFDEEPGKVIDTVDFSVVLSEATSPYADQ